MRIRVEDLEGSLVAKLATEVTTKLKIMVENDEMELVAVLYVLDNGTLHEDSWLKTREVKE